jgi:nucleoside-diphosphate-sugar epimerase
MILVTGATGNAGGAVVRALARDGRRVPKRQGSFAPTGRPHQSRNTQTIQQLERGSSCGS